MRVQGTRVLQICVRAHVRARGWHLGDGVTLSELGARRAERAERAGRGGAERSAEQPLPASADPRPSARLYGQELAAAAHPGAGAWWVGAGTALAPFQLVRGLGGEGPCSQKALPGSLPPKPPFLQYLGL